MVERLVQSLLDLPEVAQIIITQNIPESCLLTFPERVLCLQNLIPKGFAANHNAAFQHCCHPLFCVMNPDVALSANPFPHLIASIENAQGAVVAPLVSAPDGCLEDSIRRFPSIRSLLAKALYGSDGRYDLKKGTKDFFPDWVAGMFMLFQSRDFQSLHGFDEGFFLYYEDVDICVRTWKTGMRVVACPSVVIEHDARRDSRRNPRYLIWHLLSMARYFAKHWGRLPRRR
jgi:N-acetylglucosaminyl-diphospho-decaprenol L-rhamnosyltransferase